MSNITCSFLILSDSYRVMKVVLLRLLTVSLLGQVILGSVHAQQGGLVQGEILVKFMDQASEADRKAVESELGLVLVKHHTSIGIYHYRSDAADIWTLISNVRSSPFVYFAEPNYVRERQSAPNDEFYKLQWYLPKIGWESARATFTGTAPVIVAVIDSGVTKLHKHLEGYRAASGEWDFVQNDSDANDESGHGTMVAGIITGATGDGKNVAGICPTARILPIRVFDNAGFIAEGHSVDVSVLIAALDQARRHGARIINLSLGASLYSFSEQLALSACDSAGILIVCAAGNGNSQGLGVNNDNSPIYPASYNIPGIISVAATDEEQQLSVFSNFGQTSVDIAAPGQFIVGCDVPRKTLYTWDFRLGWQGWSQFVLSGNGWVWDYYLGRPSLVTSGPWPYYAGSYAPNSSTTLLSPLVDLRNQKGARLDMDVIGRLGADDYLSLSTKRSGETETTYGGILLYPGWAYETIQRDISRLDGSVGEIDIYLFADLFGWGTYSSGTLALDRASISVLDQGAFATEAVWYADGTSFAAPIVSGVAAMIMSQNPQLSHLQVRQKIFDTATRVSSLSGKVATGAVVNARTALASATKGSQTINFTQPPAQTFTPNKTFSLVARATSGQPVTFTSSNVNVVSVAGNIATIKAAGSATITATQGGNATYKPAPNVLRTVTVAKADQSIRPFVGANNVPFNTVLIFTNTKSSVGLPVTFQPVSGPVAITNHRATVTGVGAVVVRAVQAGNNNYNAATPLTNRFTTIKANQAITFTNLPASVAFRANGTIPLSARSSSALPVAYVSGNTNILQIVGTNAVMKRPGTNTLTAVRLGNANYNPAPSVKRTIVIK